MLQKMGKVLRHSSIFLIPSNQHYHLLRTMSTKQDQITPEKSNMLVKVKSEPLKEDDGKPDIRQFKFEKKPHIKIEYDKESPSKSETKGLWEPPHWRQFLAKLKIMRAGRDAPVDSMGCHMSMDHDAKPEVMRYQSLVSLMLSSQTKDQVTFAAMARLRERGLTVDNVLALSDDELGKLIYPVGFWKTKVKYIKKTTQTLKEQYNGDIPDTVEKLCKLTGVGPKMAHICMSVAWNKVTGIGVDTHVHRISNRIGWVKKPTPTPEDTRKSLESWLPFDLWGEVNHLLVGFGQKICQPVSPLCNECLNKDICPSSGKGRKTPNKKSPMKKEKDVMDLKQELTEDFKLEEESKGDGVGRKRKTPIKKSPIKQETDAMDADQEIAEDLKVDTLEVPSRSEVRIRKRKTPTKKAEINQDTDEKQESSESLNVANGKKKTPNKNTSKESATNVKQEVYKINDDDDNDFEEGKEINLKPKTIPITKKGKDKSNIDNVTEDVPKSRVKSKKNYNSLEIKGKVVKSPVKRKSPRIKELVSDETKKNKLVK